MNFVKSKFGFFIALAILLVVGAIYFLPTSSADEYSVNRDYVVVEDFGAIAGDGKDDSIAIQKAIDHASGSEINQVLLSGTKPYSLSKGIVLKEDVHLVMGKNTRIYVSGNHRVVDIKKDASITNGTFEIVDKSFDSEVLYLDGDQKLITWNTTSVYGVNIINSSNTHKGTALSLSSDEEGDYISFVNFENMNLVGFHTGIRLEAKNPGKGKFAYINANRFDKISLDSCVSCIELKGSTTVPNETSGNQFSNIQVQTEAFTKSVFEVNGMINTFDAVIWDVHKAGDDPLVTFTSSSQGNTFHSNLKDGLILDKGKSNLITSPYLQTSPPPTPDPEPEPEPEPEPVPSTDFISHWKASEGIVGTDWKDKNGAIAKLNNVTKKESSIAFKNLATSYVSFPIPKELTKKGTPFTFEYAFKTNEIGTNPTLYLSEGSCVGAYSDYGRWGTWFEFPNADSCNTQGFWVGQQFSNNTLYNITVTYDGDKEIKYYLDGKQLSKQTVKEPIVFSKDNTLTFGKGFKGELVSLKFYNIVSTP